MHDVTLPAAALGAGTENIEENMNQNSSQEP